MICNGNISIVEISDSLKDSLGRGNSGYMFIFRHISYGIIPEVLNPLKLYHAWLYDTNRRRVAIIQANAFAMFDLTGVTELNYYESEQVIKTSIVSKIR